MSFSCGDSSDSENENGAFEKLRNAVDHLFTGTNSDRDGSESAESSATEEETEELEVETEEETNSNRSNGQGRAVFLKKHCNDKYF